MNEPSEQRLYAWRCAHCERMQPANTLMYWVTVEDPRLGSAIQLRNGQCVRCVNGPWRKLKQFLSDLLSVRRKPA